MTKLDEKIKVAKSKAFELNERTKGLLGALGRPGGWCSINGCGDISPWEPWDPDENGGGGGKPPVKPPEDKYPNWTGKPGEPAMFKYKTVDGRVGISGLNWDYINSEYNGIIPDPLVMSSVSNTGAPVTFIDEGAFQREPLATTVAVPSPIQHIEAFSFQDCGIKNLVLNDELLTIGATEHDYSAFAGNRIEELHMPPKLVSIGGSAFAWNNISKIKWYGEAIDKISDSTFQHNNLSEVVLPRSVKTIRRNAYDSNAIKELTIPSGVINIESRAFANNEITKVKIDGRVKIVGRSAFVLNPITSFGVGDGVESLDEPISFLVSDIVVYANLRGEDYNNEEQFRIRGAVFDRSYGIELRPLDEYPD